MPEQKGWRQLDIRPTYYETWMEKEGIPVYEGFAAIEDITELPRRSWARLGGYGTFIELEGMIQARKLVYVAEIPAGGALESEKHLYNELIYILRGRGLSEVWQERGAKRTFEWGKGSLFAIPLNAWHRLVNGGQEPVLFYAVTNAPAVMEAFRNTEFIFNCDYKFTDHYSGQADYFLTREIRYEQRYGERRGVWETNFLPDLRTVFLGDHLTPWKIEGGRLTTVTMAGWSVGIHTSDWPVGTYHKAHYHGPGAIILGLKSEGYVLIWDPRYGIHPFQDGHGDKVIKVDWKPNSMYSPPNEWFHQHFNTGWEEARHLAETSGQLRVALPTIQEGKNLAQSPGVRGHSIRDGDKLIEYEDEDPEIRRMFQEALRQKGIEFAMNPVVYRTDPLRFFI